MDADHRCISRAAAAAALASAFLAILASAHGRLLGVRPEAYLLAANLWLALAAGTAGLI